MNFTIRPIQPGEEALAKWLVCAVARDQFHPEMTVEKAAAYWDAQGILADLNDIPGSYAENGGVFLVVEVDGQIAGTGGFHRAGKAGEAPDGECELRRLYLLPQHRSCGLGRAMLGALIARAREMGYRRMSLLTDPQAQPRAVELYRRAGFTPAPCREGDDADDLRMVIEL